MAERQPKHPIGWGTAGPRPPPRGAGPTRRRGRRRRAHRLPGSGRLEVGRGPIWRPCGEVRRGRRAPEAVKLRTERGGRGKGLDSGPACMRPAGEPGKPSRLTPPRSCQLGACAVSAGLWLALDGMCRLPGTGAQPWLWRLRSKCRLPRTGAQPWLWRLRRRSSILLSSVPLQMQFYLSGFYYVFYFLISLLVIFYKTYLFSYPLTLWTMDMILLWSMGVLEALRLYLGAKGNLTEEEMVLGSSLLLTIINAILSLYFLLWATFVLRIDVVLNIILLTLYSLEGTLQVVTIAAFVS
ncbi:transmembrane protein 80 isoform X1 [Notamacropus eugenii]|uniref:transmembrane protein 80 isoform X1 n=1 Tax=Notamacropus eugenii TaxID=9315 RepID=UPI003B66E095